MDPAEATNPPPESHPPLPGKSPTLTDRLTDLVEPHKKELFFGITNFGLYISTLMLDDPNLDHVRLPSAHTTGPLGFIEQHMEGSMEVMAMFYLARVPVSLAARGIEIISNKKIDPRIKVGTAILLAVAAASALELMKKPSGESLHGGVPDPLDALGNVAAGIYVAVAHQVIDYLFKPQETPLSKELDEKISQVFQTFAQLGLDASAVAQRLGKKWYELIYGFAPPSESVATLVSPDKIPPQT